MYRVLLLKFASVEYAKMMEMKMLMLEQEAGSQQAILVASPPGCPPQFAQPMQQKLLP